MTALSEMTKCPICEAMRNRYVVEGRIGPFQYEEVTFDCGYSAESRNHGDSVVTHPCRNSTEWITVWQERNTKITQLIDYARGLFSDDVNMRVEIECALDGCYRTLRGEQ